MPAAAIALQVLKCPYKSKPEENKEKVHLHYSNTVDSWAVGVLVYELLVGCPPFYDKSKSTTEARIVNGVPHFPPTMSEGAKSFICAGEDAAKDSGSARAQCVCQPASLYSTAQHPMITMPQHHAMPCAGPSICRLHVLSGCKHPAVQHTPRIDGLPVAPLH